MQGYLDEVGLHTLRGWAADASNRLPKLQLSVNGSLRKSTQTCVDRPDLVSVVGRSDLGFLINVSEPISVGDTVAVTDTQGRHVVGSPMRVTNIAATRQEKALAMADRRTPILEIGPSFNPMAPRSQGWNSYSLDHATQEELQEKYRGAQKVENIEPVDFLWKGGAIEAVVPQELHGTFGVVLASHVIEHFPDPIGFYLSAAKLLKPDGFVSLVVPDKRLMFDFFKPVSMTSDILYVHRNRNTRHTKKTAFDNSAYNVKDGEAIIWDWRKVGEFGFLSGDSSLDLAKRAFDDAIEDESGEYVDFHHTIYTPASFALIILELSQLGVIPFSVEKSYPTEHGEFFVTLKKNEQTRFSTDALNSERLRLLKEMVREQAEQARWLEDN